MGTPCCRGRVRAELAVRLWKRQRQDRAWGKFSPFLAGRRQGARGAGGGFHLRKDQAGGREEQPGGVPGAVCWEEQLLEGWMAAAFPSVKRGVSVTFPPPGQWRLVWAGTADAGGLPAAPRILSYEKKDHGRRPVCHWSCPVGHSSCFCSAAYT